MGIHEDQIGDRDITWSLNLVRYHPCMNSLRSDTSDFRASGNSDRRYESVLIELCMTVILQATK